MIMRKIRRAQGRKPRAPRVIRPIGDSRRMMTNHDGGCRARPSTPGDFSRLRNSPTVIMGAFRRDSAGAPRTDLARRPAGQVCGPNCCWPLALLTLRPPAVTSRCITSRQRRACQAAPKRPGGPGQLSLNLGSLDPFAGPFSPRHPEPSGEESQQHRRALPPCTGPKEVVMGTQPAGRTPAPAAGRSPIARAAGPSYAWPDTGEGRVQITDGHAAKADLCGHLHGESRAEAERCAESLATRLNSKLMPSDYYLG